MMFKKNDDVSGEWREKSFFDYALEVANIIRVALIAVIAAIMNTVGLGFRNWQYWAILFVVLVLVLLSSFVAAQHHAHLMPESLATSQAVINASALEQSDGDTPPALPRG